MQRTLISTLFLITVASASATTITIQAASSVADATAQENAWILANFGTNFDAQILEGFEGFTASSTTAYNSLATGVGTFSVMPGSQAGDPYQSNGTKTDQFTILNAGDSPFSGRFNTTPGGSNWLDTNDISQIQLTTSLDILVFMITDVNDCGGLLTIQTADGTTSSAFAPYPAATDGNLYFVAITSNTALGTVSWLNNTTNDGFGLDSMGTVVDPPPPTAPAPEPASLAISGAGLAAIALFKKYKTARA
jgi:hypothetical protein